MSHVQLPLKAFDFNSEIALEGYAHLVRPEDRLENALRLEYWHEGLYLAILAVKAIIEEVTKMKALGASAALMQEAPKRQELDVHFQSIKAQISKIIDGQAGFDLPHCHLEHLPLLLQTLPVVVNSESKHIKPSSYSFNLLTGYKVEGYGYLALGSTLNAQAACIDLTVVSAEDYFLNLEGDLIAIENIYLGDRLLHGLEFAEIIEYCSSEGRFKLTRPLKCAPGDAVKLRCKHHSKKIPFWGCSRLDYAEWLWGADNYRELPRGNFPFVPLSDEEKKARAEREFDCPAALTSKEKLIRRSRNIYDPHFGSLVHMSYAKRMHQQVTSCLKQLNRLLKVYEDSLAQLRQYFFLQQPDNYIRGYQSALEGCIRDLKKLPLPTDGTLFDMHKFEQLTKTTLNRSL